MNNYKNKYFNLIILLPIFLVFFFSYPKLGYISIFHYSILLSVILIFFLKRKFDLPINFYFYLIIFTYLIIHFYYLNNFLYDKFIIGLIYYFIFFNIFNNYFSNKIFIACLLIIIFSCFISILQSININFAWDVRYFISEIFNNDISYQLIDRQKSTGMAFNNIQLQYHILSCLFFSEYIFRNKKIKLLLTLFLLCTVVITNSLSALLILLFWILIFHFNFKFIILFVFPIFSIYVFDNYYVSSLFDRSILDNLLIRFYLLFINSLVFFQNPLGLPVDEFIQERNRIFENLLYTKFYYQNYLGYINDYSHNNFINIALYTGLLGLLLYIYFYFNILIETFLNYKKNISLVSKNFFCFFLCYLILMISHNSGPFFGDPTFWLILSFYIYNKNENNFKKFN